MGDQRLDVPPWMLPVLVAALVVPIALAWLLVAPFLGILLAGLLGAIVVLVAIRMAPRRRLGRPRR